MKKRVMFIIMFVMFAFTMNVSAANKVVKPEDSDFNSFKSQYQNGIQTSTINGSGTVTLYGYSSCQTGNCSFKYANTSQDFKEVLKQAIVCSGGEKYIIYQTTGGADGYKTSNSENYIGEVYWSEDFNITCTNTQTANTLTINTSNQQVQNQQNQSNGNFNTADTTTNEDQGVETYYIILGIVGIITYFLTILVKKQNLFKKV